MVFGQNMIFPIEHIAMWEFNQMIKQILINKNSKAENAKQWVHLYQEGNLVLLQKKNWE